MASHVETSVETLDRLRLEVADLRASRKRLALAADADRRRIERELHDGVQQHLIALAVNLQLVRDLVADDPVAAETLLDDMGRDVQVALDESGRLAQLIYPPLLEAGGLAAALRAAAASAGVPTRIEVEARTRYPAAVAGAVYFCCLAAIEHAGDGARATIAVREEAGALVFDVAESGGAALSAEAVAPARDRVEAIGGRLVVQSEPAGSRLSGSVPLSR